MNVRERERERNMFDNVKGERYCSLTQIYEKTEREREKERERERERKDEREE